MATNEPGDFLERLAGMVQRSAPSIRRRAAQAQRAKNAAIRKRIAVADENANLSLDKPITDVRIEP